MKTPKPVSWKTALVLLFLVALWLRWPYPEPAWTHIDEQRAFLEYPLGILGGDLNPHFFNYPSLQLYLTAAFYYLHYLVSSYETLDGFVAYYYLVDPSALLLAPRGLTSLMSAATVVVLFFLSRRLYGSARSGLCAGAVLATMPLHVRFSHLAATDIPMTLWVSLAMLAAVRIAQDQQHADYLWAGLFTGLAGSTKYPGALVAVAVIAAAWPRCPIWRNRPLFLSGFIALLVLAATTPYAWLDFDTFWQHVSAMGYSHLGERGGQGALLVYQHLRYGLGIIGLVCIPLLLVVRLKVPPRTSLVLLLPAICIFVLMLSGSGFMRYALPLAPLLAVLLARLGVLLRARALTACLIVLVAEPLWVSYHTRQLLSGPDTREQTAAWLLTEFPTGARITHHPGGPALQLPILDQHGILSRRSGFVRRFGQQRFVDACALLAERRDLPPLFISWGTDAARRHLYTAGERVQEQAVSLLYEHPIVDAGTKPEPPDGFVAERVFDPAGLRDAVFDLTDWYYLPIGNMSATHSTGPLIRAGQVPFTVNAPRPTTAEFFRLAGLDSSCRELLRRSEWRRARSCYQTLVEGPLFLVELFGDMWVYDIYMEAALSHYETGAKEAALTSWRRASAVHTAFESSVQIASSGHEESIQPQFDEVDFIYGMARVYAKSGHLARSLAALGRVVKLRPSAQAYINKGRIHGQLGQLEEQSASFARALQLEPDHPLAPQLMATDKH